MMDKNIVSVVEALIESMGQNDNLPLRMVLKKGTKAEPGNRVMYVKLSELPSSEVDCDEVLYSSNGIELYFTKENYINFSDSTIDDVCLRSYFNDDEEGRVGPELIRIINEREGRYEEPVPDIIISIVQEALSYESPLEVYDD